MNKGTKQFVILVSVVIGVILLLWFVGLQKHVGHNVDVFEERLSREGGKDGPIRVSLVWENENDLDLFVIDPNGEEINLANKHSRSGGELDVDMNFEEDELSGEPVENVVWPEGTDPPHGTYQVYVSYYNVWGCTDGPDGMPTDFQVMVKLDGESEVYEDFAEEALNSSCPDIIELGNDRFSDVRRNSGASGLGKGNEQNSVSREECEERGIIVAVTEFEY